MIATERITEFKVTIGRHPQLGVGLTLVCVVILVAIFAPWLSPYDPEATSSGNHLLPPSRAHWMGTDGIGMDVFSRVLYATRVDVSVAIAATTLSMLIGVPLGLVTGYYTNMATEAVVRISDLLQSFPAYVLGMLFVVVTGHAITNLIYVIAILSFPIYLRLTRSQSLFLRSKTFVEEAKVIGRSDLAILFVHILPNSLSPTLAQASVTMGWSIFLTAGLSFIGAGVVPPTPEWGSMVATGASNIVAGGKWWPSVFPGLAIVFTVLGFAMVGDAVHDILDPRRR